MKIDQKKRNFSFNNFQFSAKRTTNGVVEFWVKNKLEMAQAMGHLHAHDRMMQMMLVRVIGQGRLSELLKADEDTLIIDKFMREMSFYHQAKKEVQEMSAEVREFGERYCKGVNDYLENNRRPFEFILAGLKPEPWKIEDTLLTIKLMSYMGLAQTQQEIEKLILQMVQNDTPIDKLKNLFSPHLDHFSDEQIALVKKAKFYQNPVPDNVKWMAAIPKVLASNNWVLSPGKSKSGNALQCNDPHLEVNRLPAIWYEFIAHTEDNYYMGVNMPGVPGLVMGRNKNVSYGFTYGFMDLVDYFIDEVKDHKVRDGENFEKMNIREEFIKRKGKHSVPLYLRETKNGVLEWDPQKQLEDGLYFTRAWSGHNNGALGSLLALYNFHDVSTVKEAQIKAQAITISCNWLISDKEGNIGYQQSGRFPHRTHSGLHPLEGWIKENRWQGIRNGSDLASSYNPEEGFITTANNDMNQEGKPLSINMPMGSYRADRVRELLLSQEKFDIEDMKKYQADLFSTQARSFMNELSPLIDKEKNEASKILLNWNLCYDKKSKGCVVFEYFYARLFDLVYGRDFLGEKTWDYIQNQTNTIIDFYANFDDVFIKTTEDHNKLWFHTKSKNDYFKEALDLTFAHFENQKIKTWGDIRKVKMNNLFFDGKLPAFLGFDYGPISIEGNRATIVQGALYESHGRTLTFCPSFRYITDMGVDETHTVLAGGVSDRRFSKYYTSDVENWLNYRYKTLRPS